MFFLQTDRHTGKYERDQDTREARREQVSNLSRTNQNQKKSDLRS